jgi:hypothetical protein
MAIVAGGWPGLPDEQRAEAGIRIIVPLRWPAGARMTVKASSAEHIPGRACREPGMCDRGNRKTGPARQASAS